MFKLYDLKGNNGEHINPWSLQVKCLLFDLGFNYLWENNNVTKLQISKVIERIHDQYIQQWYQNINTSSKLESYSKYKSILEYEKYLDCIQNNKHRIALTRLRCSAHKLAIEEGRHRNVDRNNRVCTKCNMGLIECEYHFVLVCPLLGRCLL